MDLFIIPRRVARLPYETARLPFTILDECVVARWEALAVPRVGFELFLGLTDTVAGWLLADDHISGRGQALLRRTESPAMPGERETKPQANRAQLEENLRATREAAHQVGHQAAETISTAAGNQQQQEDRLRLEDAAAGQRPVKYRPEEEAGDPGSP